MSAKHTPGPFVARPFPGGNEPIHICDDETIVATVHRRDGYADLAAKFAAAPEMWAALRNARAVLASTETSPSWDIDRRRALDEIAAAIAKARGE